MPHQCPAVCVRFAPSPAEPPELVQHNVDVAVCIFGDDRRGKGHDGQIGDSCDFTSKRPRPPLYPPGGLDWGLKSVGQNRPIAKFTKGRDTKKNATRSLPCSSRKSCKLDGTSPRSAHRFRSSSAMSSATSRDQPSAVLKG